MGMSEEREGGREGGMEGEQIQIMEMVMKEHRHAVRETLLLMQARENE